MAPVLLFLAPPWLAFEEDEGAELLADSEEERDVGKAWVRRKVYETEDLMVDVLPSVNMVVVGGTVG